MTARKVAAADAKKPQDRKAAKPKVTTRDGKMTATVRGLRLTIEKELMDDWEVVERLALMEEEKNPVYMPLIMKQLLGEDQYMSVKDKIRDPKTNRITFEAGQQFFNELFEVFNPNS